MYDAIMGVAVGDAFGFPYQFMPRGTFKVKEKMVARGGRLGLPAGSWSDDTALTLATIDSIVECQEINIEDMMINFALWLIRGHFTPFGYAFDIGGGTMQSINNYINGEDVTACGLRTFNANGNGSLMRILPLAFLPSTLDEIAAVSSLTHAHPISVHACQIQIAIAKEIICGYDVRDAIERVMNQEPYNTYEEYAHLTTVQGMELDEISGSGYVLNTLTAALWCLTNTYSYHDCIIRAVNLGEDTDTVAAVAGGLAGLMYGIGGKRGIPTKWISAIQASRLVEDMCTDYEVLLDTVGRWWEK